MRWRGLLEGHFWSFDPPNPKDQNFEKMKKTLGHIIILHLCTTNDDHMMHGFWNIKHDRQNFFDILCYSVLLPHWQPEKSKMKKNGWRYHFTLGHHKWQSCVVPEIWSMTDKTFLTLDHFLPFYPLTTQKIKILKIWKDISSFYTSVPKIMIISYTVP